MPILCVCIFKPTSEFTVSEPSKTHISFRIRSATAFPIISAIVSICDRVQDFVTNSGDDVVVVGIAKLLSNLTKKELKKII